MQVFYPSNLRYANQVRITVFLPVGPQNPWDRTGEQLHHMDASKCKIMKKKVLMSILSVHVAESRPDCRCLLFLCLICNRIAER